MDPRYTGIQGYPKKDDTGCPTKHDSWWIVLDVFFHTLLSCLIPKKIIKNISWQSYYSKMDFKIKYIWVKGFLSL